MNYSKLLILFSNIISSRAEQVKTLQTNEANKFFFSQSILLVKFVFVIFGLPDYHLAYAILSSIRLEISERDQAIYRKVLP